MTESRFNEIKHKINQAELDSASAKGKIETIHETWKNEYGFETVEEAQSKLEELKKDRDEKIEKRNELMNKLEQSFNWDSL